MGRKFIITNSLNVKSWLEKNLDNIYNNYRTP